MGEHHRFTELVERVRIAHRKHWCAGNRVPVEVEFARHLLRQAHPEDALELIYHEVLLREEGGECPRLEEYAGRFPELTPQLALLFEVHQALESGSLLQELRSIR